MVAKNTAETDDQIIDLTELIEKGEVPANDPSEQPQAVAAPEAEADQKALNAHLRGLNDGSSAADAEIDDLLAQMDIKDEGQSDPNDVALDFSAPSTQTDHPIDPNEQLLMPGMGDVDNLLNALDIPPQPAEREPEVAAPASASQATSQAADDAVDALLNDFHAAAPAPQAPAEPQESIPDLDELLASVNTAPTTGNSSDIDDLLNAANLAPAQPEPAAAPPVAPAAQRPFPTMISTAFWLLWQAVRPRALRRPPPRRPRLTLLLRHLHLQQRLQQHPLPAQTWGWISTACWLPPLKICRASLMLPSPKRLPRRNRLLHPSMRQPLRQARICLPTSAWISTACWLPLLMICRASLTLPSPKRPLCKRPRLPRNPSPI